MASVAMKFGQADPASVTPANRNAEVLSIRPVPRITIHAFCVSPDVASTLESIERDRRMSRASLVLQPGGVAAAFSTYSAAPTPDLIILEHSNGDNLLARLDELSTVCDVGTRVIVIGNENDIGLYRELMRRGVSEYVHAPFSQLEMIAAISEVYSDGDHEKFGRICAFFGATGGAGSSTIAQNVAWAIGERLGSGVILADLDLAFGTAALNFNLEPEHGIADALRDTDRLDEIMLDRLLSKCGEHLSLLSAPALLDKNCDFDADALEKVLDLAQAATPHVVLDMPHVWTGWSRRTLVAADEIVMTATPDLAGLRNAKHLIDLLREARPNDAPPKLVLNQLNTPKRPEVKPSEFASVLKIEPAALIPFDPKLFGEAAMTGTMFASTAERGVAAEAIASLAADITGRKVQETRKRGMGGLRRMLAGSR